MCARDGEFESRSVRTKMLKKYPLNMHRKNSQLKQHENFSTQQKSFGTSKFQFGQLESLCFKLKAKKYKLSPSVSLQRLKISTRNWYSLKAYRKICKKRLPRLASRSLLRAYLGCKSLQYVWLNPCRWITTTFWNKWVF